MPERPQVTSKTISTSTVRKATIGAVHTAKASPNSLRSTPGFTRKIKAR